MEQEINLAVSKAEQALSETQRFWFKHYQACQSSGQSLAAYARDHGLPVTSFYYWKRRLQQLEVIESAPLRPSPHPVFHSVRVQPVTEMACRLRFPNGVACELAEVDESALERLLLTLSRLPR